MAHNSMPVQAALPYVHIGYPYAATNQWPLVSVFSAPYWLDLGSNVNCAFTQLISGAPAFFIEGKQSTQAFPQ